jgi:AcrR family transcriptional regulator
MIECMGRWEPDARGRLAKAALELYAAQGFDQTTVAEIASRAGLTERTFFRHFADKREVLFDGSDALRDLMLLAAADAPESATPVQAASAAFEAAGAVIQENPERARLRDAVISANAELRERELIKLAWLASAVTTALRDRGVPEPTATLVAEAGVAVFKVAFVRWVASTGDLTEIIRETMGMLADQVAYTREDRKARDRVS